jgi:hypothetical protein
MSIVSIILIILGSLFLLFCLLLAYSLIVFRRVHARMVQAEMKKVVNAFSGDLEDE